MVKQPKPPTQAEVDASLAAEMLRRLGANDDGELRQRVYDKLVSSWREQRSPPKPADMARALSMPPNTVCNCLMALVRAGRVIRLRRGVYIPVVPNEANHETKKHGPDPKVQLRPNNVRRPR